jgi:hypothetical protein
LESLISQFLYNKAADSGQEKAAAKWDIGPRA